MSHVPILDKERLVCFNGIMTNTPELVHQEADDVLSAAGASPALQRRFLEARAEAIDSLRKAARKALDLATKIEAENGEDALFALRSIVGHAGYSNTLQTEVTTAYSAMARAQGIVEAVHT